MTFQFFLSKNSGLQKNIHLRITDNQQNKIYNFRTDLVISEENWDKEKQRPCNIYLKKYKLLNAKLDRIKRKQQDILTIKKQVTKKFSDVKYHAK
ncbi:hypothetical protein CLU97_0476 [Chryseobacterium sp. 7]|uniref:hypothetical protein n=1 Tax=Chryseobacterium sp. 7 TaxID=2035214 RepID=UPI000F150E4D|nr:hypothetical protein [Chryseobacterium sp. 7]RLJ31074.1 hypothetical protein CLU97_0476 [Chryseobacterium sp. 7]